MKHKLSDEAWADLVPILANVDGGCPCCIAEFLSDFAKSFFLTKEMAGQFANAGIGFGKCEMETIFPQEDGK